MTKGPLGGPRPFARGLFPQEYTALFTAGQDSRNRVRIPDYINQYINVVNGDNLSVQVYGLTRGFLNPGIQTDDICKVIANRQITITQKMLSDMGYSGGEPVLVVIKDVIRE